MKRLFKKLLFVVTMVFIAVACSLDSDSTQDFDMVFIPIESVTMPDYVTSGQTSLISMQYRKTNDCYYVSDEPLYEINGTTRTVAIQAVVIERANCRTIEYAAPETKSFNFTCPITAERNFTFKFYQGVNAQGEDQYLEVIVPVQQ